MAKKQQKILIEPDKQPDPFDKWAGALAEGKGLSKAAIVRQLRKERGWPK
jgi:hypothetical protein